MTATLQPTIPAAPRVRFIAWTADLSRADVSRVGGKAANLGELARAGVPVPPAFVISIDGYARFRSAGGIGDAIDGRLAGVNVDDATALQKLSRDLRALIEATPIPADLEAEITAAYAQLGENSRRDISVAVRSSATAEDTKQFSFAGMFESFLGVRGRDALLRSVRACWASTFHARALYYRVKRDLPAEMPVAVVVQKMIDADKAGVLFTVDPGTHDDTRMVIEAAWGLGEVVVLGQVTPDRYVLDKASLSVVEHKLGVKNFLLESDDSNGAPQRVDLARDPRRAARVLTDANLDALGELGRRVEQHYGAPQDIEFAIDRDKVYLVQSRPITTLAQPSTRPDVSQTVEAIAPAGDVVIARGLGASPGIVSGVVRLLESPDKAAEFRQGEILVARMTSPDWVPLMRQAAAIVTDAGGMTSHAAIVSRELGVPCVVGTGTATTALHTGLPVTVDGGRGLIYAGLLAASPSPAMEKPAVTPPQTVVSSRTVTATRVYVNLAEPERAEEVARQDVDGVGLLRAEFLLLSALNKTHPRKLIAEGRQDEIVRRLAEGIRIFGRAFAPRPVIYRAMDFRTNEFRGLTGGEEFEPVEENPMIGYRGCYRYIKEPDLFALELRALADVRSQCPNVHLMIPFVRTAWEFRECKRLIDASALANDRTLQLWVMAEVPSVVHWLPEYAKLGATGVSIGSNDLTQLMLGVDRDGERVAPLFDERDGAVLAAIERIVAECRRLGLTSSICGQAPSTHPEYAEFLVRCGITSISVTPDALERTRRNVAAAEQRILVDAARRGT